MHVTKTGKVMRRRATSNHFLQKKSASRKRTFAGVEQITGTQVKSIKRNLGI
jgi:ribosomal protein L35